MLYKSKANRCLYIKKDNIRCKNKMLNEKYCYHHRKFSNEENNICELFIKKLKVIDFESEDFNVTFKSLNLEDKDTIIENIITKFKNISIID